MAARRWLERYPVQSTPRLQHFAKITTCPAKFGPRGSSDDDPELATHLRIEER
jgi:hypothetical protein